MKYNTVKIIPNKSFEGNLDWEVEFSSSDLEREETKTIPNTLGFFHYPETMSNEKAFEILKQAMLKRHLEEIENLTKSFEKLTLKSFK